MKYIIYGDYGYVSEQELHSRDNRHDAIRWAANYCHQLGMTGYDIIDVVYSTADGVYVSIWRMESEEHEFIYDEF